MRNGKLILAKESGLLDDLDKFAYERMLCGSQEVVVLERFVEWRGKLTYWKVLDELLLPSMECGYAALDVLLCESANYPESAVLAVGVWGNAENGALVAKNISHALRFNLDAVKIEPISTHDVVCESEYQD